VGAAGRLLKRRRWRDAAALAAGLVLLAHSRPYEGLIFSLPILAFLAWRARGRLAPAAAVLAVAALWTGYYWAQFTGNPFRMPYAFYRATLAEAPHFVFQSPRRVPPHLHRETRAYYSIWEMASYRDARANRPPHGVVDKLKSYARFYAGPVWAIPLALSLAGWRRSRVRLFLLTLAAISAAVLVEVWHSPHYAAPALGVVVLLAVEGLRQARLIRRAAWVVPAICAASLFVPVVHGGTRVGDGRQRERIQRKLAASRERHLVVVRYRHGHDPGDEWVYNGADLDQAPVVWAREMDPLSNRRLLDYFRGRRVWLVEPDARPVQLSPYDPSILPDPPFAFVPFGTEGVEALRSAEEVGRKVLARVDPDSAFTCDRWNWEFTQATGILPPDAARGCFPPGARGQPIGFTRWFAWLQAQR
jgi:hypothetical protein